MVCHRHVNNVRYGGYPAFILSDTTSKLSHSLQYGGLSRQVPLEFIGNFFRAQAFAYQARMNLVESLAGEMEDEAMKKDVITGKGVSIILKSINVKYKVCFERLRKAHVF